MFESVLIANRGEIAVRVIRTLRRMGIRSVAVYSDADAAARHVREADIAIRLGSAAARESYLSIERILDAAARSGAQAIHPGYGFLSENAEFLQACADAGVIAIAPPVAAVNAMGDKIRAKTLVGSAGVPVVPGIAEPGLTDAALINAAAEIGYPVLIKPSAGGGGKGMRLVHDGADLPAQLASARREAASSFGDDTLFLERFVLRPRHIEVQVLADQHGTTIHLGDRECSLQRRHQKVIEEAPSPLLDDEARHRLGMLGVATAEAVGYVGAGTVEFIVSGDREDEPFFMEMNTRLQVEHPVTEMVTGIDLVEQQVRIAAGEALGVQQADVRLSGHAVEARLYAEDPDRDFVPTGGRILLLREPEGSGVRIDSSLVEGNEVGSAYDPMLSKVIAWAPGRVEALATLDAAIGNVVALGVTTNQSFLRALLRHPDVRAGRLDTGLLERSLDDLLSDEIPAEVFAAYGLRRLIDARRRGPVVDPWQIPSGWRLGVAHPLHWDVDLGRDRTATVFASGSPENCSIWVDSGHPMAASAVETADGLLVTIDGVARTVWTAREETAVWIHLDGSQYRIVEREPVRASLGAAVGGGEVRSPMPGNVVAVHVTAGDAVDEGASLLVVEAMKMEYVLAAPVAGTIASGIAQLGQQVVVDQVLAVVEPANEGDEE